MKEEYPSCKSHHEAEAKNKLHFSTEKLCFQPCLSFMPTISEVLRRSDEPFEDERAVSKPHCLRCHRTGFVGGVPA